MQCTVNDHDDDEEEDDDYVRMKRRVKMLIRISKS